MLLANEIPSSEIERISIGVDAGGMGIIHVAEWKGIKIAIKEASSHVISKEASTHFCHTLPIALVPLKYIQNRKGEGILPLDLVVAVFVLSSRPGNVMLLFVFRCYWTCVNYRKVAS